MQWTRRFGAVVVVALFVCVGQTACSSSFDLFEDECTTDADCAAGYQCNKFIAAVCEPTCSVVKCKRGTVCDDSFGVATCETGCASNDDCPPHTFCKDCWFCWSPPQCAAGCHDDSECGAGQFCSGGSCITQCVTNSDCTVGHVCAAGLIGLLSDAGTPCVASEKCSCIDCTKTSLGACAALDSGAADGGAADGGADGSD